jgi:hypothetical protein
MWVRFRFILNFRLVQISKGAWIVYLRITEVIKVDDRNVLLLAFVRLLSLSFDLVGGLVQPLNYVPFFNRVSGTGGLMFRAWWGRM